MGNGSAAGMWMKGSSLQSLLPASRTSTLVPASAESRLASAQPAEPPPTMTMSYLSLATVAPSALEPALLSGTDVVPDVLGLAVLLQPGEPELASDARLLVAAPLGLRHVGVV